MAALPEPAEVRAHLIAAAQAGTALTYSEVLERLGYTFSRPKMRALCAILGAVDDEAEARGEPELAVLVVRQSDGLPGQGWWVAQARRAAAHSDAERQARPGLRLYEGPWEGPAARAFIDAIQAETFAWWQSQGGTSGETPPR